MANPVTRIILSAVDRTKAAFGSAKSGLASIGESAGNLKSLLGSLFAGLSLVGFIGQIKSVANEMDNAVKSAKAAGTSVEKFSALSYASGQSGGGPEVLQKSLIKLSGSLEESQDKASKAAATWRKLNLDPKQYGDSSDALLAISERFKAMPDGIAKTNLAVDLFGEKIGPKMIPLLNEGREGIKSLTDEAQRLGKVLDDETGAAAERFNDTLDRLNARKTSLFAKALPSLEQYVSALDEIIERGSAFEKLAFFTTGFISEDVLNRISDAGTRVQDYNTEIFKLQQQLVELRRVEGDDSPNGKIWEQRIAALAATRATLIDAERKSNEKRKRDNDKTSEGLIDNYAAESNEFKKSTNEQISDAQRLQSALQSAFSASIKAESDYLRQAKKLRDEAAGGGTAGSDPESQARATLDAVIAAMRLQREAGNASLESVQDQAEALRAMASQIDDVAKSEDFRRQANLAEAAALERAAAEERSRYQGLAEQQAESARQSENLKAALDGIGKEVSVEIKMDGLDKAIAGLEKYAHLIDVIKAKGPIDATSSGASGGASADSLRTAALQYGRRN